MGRSSPRKERRKSYFCMEILSCMKNVNKANFPPCCFDFLPFSNWFCRGTTIHGLLTCKDLNALLQGKWETAVNIHQLLCFTQAAQMGLTTDKITLVRNAVANIHTWGRIKHHKTNQGATEIVLGNTSKCITDCSETINTIFIDDLLEVITFKTAVMKVDIQGYEHLAFQHAEKLLDEVDVKYIVMEWDEMQHHWTKADRHLVEDMIEMLIRKHFRPYSIGRTGDVLDISKWNEWPFDVVWHK